MQFTTALVTLGALASSIMASPAAELDSRAVVTFKLQAKSADSRFNNYFLEGYHTGAGLNDITLNKDQGVDFYLNKTKLQSTIFGSATEPAGVDLAGNVEYDEWYPATLNAGYGQTGFEFNKDGQLVNSGAGASFTGWLVCNWAHAGVPQLFNTVVPSPTILRNCAKATIVKAAP